MDFRLDRVPFAALPGWGEDDPSALLGPIRRCLDHMRSVKHYRTGALGIRSADLERAFARILDMSPPDAETARALIETMFSPFKVLRADGAPGFVTAFYEPDVAVSARREGEWRFPFLRRPDDLVDLDETNRPASLDPSFMFGRLGTSGIEAYPDREAIDRGCLDGRNLEIAWAKSRVDVFFAHVQGAARLVYPDGSVTRITYAAKAGHPFTGIGRILVDRGDIPAETVSMAAIRDWLAANPERRDALLWQNRSYIFFREAPVEDPALGPVAAAKVALEPMRSIAVDRAIHTFSSLFYIASESLTHLTGGRPFNRLMIALDTGSAIVGPARGDIFTGSGPDAGERAGSVRNDADFYILVPNEIAGDLPGAR